MVTLEHDSGGGLSGSVRNQVDHNRVRPGHPLRAESWYFDFASPDGSFGGFVRLGNYPNLDVRWWWLALVRSARDPDGPVAVATTVERPIDDERPWRIEEPGLQIAIGTPDEAGRWTLSASVERPRPVGLELRWQPRGDSYHYHRGQRLEQAGWATGSLSVGGSTRSLDGPAQRDHSWGVRDWWRFGWDWWAGHLEDGERFQAVLLDARGRVPPDGYRQRDGHRHPVQAVTVRHRPGGMNALVDGHELEFDDLVSVDVPVASGQRRAVLERHLCAVRAGDGRHGIAWRERNEPSPGPGREVER